MSLGALFVRAKVKPSAGRAQGIPPQNQNRFHRGDTGGSGRGVPELRAQPACLDYSMESDTGVRDSISRADVGRVARVYPAGELAVSKVMLNSSCKAPAPTFGRREVAGVSRNGARAIRRSVVARSQQDACQFVMFMLTSQTLRSDEEMKHSLNKWLKWGRKHLGP